MNKKENTETYDPQNSILPEPVNTESDTALTRSTQSAPLEASDFVPPRLNLTQKSGELSENFKIGTWVLNKETQLTQDINEPLSVVVLNRPTKFFIEHLDFDPSGPNARVFSSLEELREAGLSADWDNVNNARPSADRAARITVLIRKPEHLESKVSFAMTIEDLGFCALASWLVVNTAYRAIAKRLFTAEKLDFGDRPFHHMEWELVAVPAKAGGYSFFAPRIMPKTWLSDKAIADIEAKILKPED